MCSYRLLTIDETISMSTQANCIEGIQLCYQELLHKLSSRHCSDISNNPMWKWQKWLLNVLAVAENCISLWGLENLDKDWKCLQNLLGLPLSEDERSLKCLALNVAWNFHCYKMIYIMTSLKQNQISKPYDEQYHVNSIL